MTCFCSVLGLLLTVAAGMSAQDRQTQVEARVAQAMKNRAGDRVESARAMVAPYGEMHPGNLAMPRVRGFIEAAHCEYARDKPLSAYKLLDYGKRNGQGIPGVLIRVAYADLVEQVPDTVKTIAYLKEAVTYGDGFFKRRMIKGESDSDPGKREAAKAGHGAWPKLRKEILSRLPALERLLHIDMWGLDYVLYLEAQEARKADVFGSDFSSLSLIYPKAEQQVSVAAKGADYAMAIDKYRIVIEDFPGGVLAEASAFYQWLCLAKLGRLVEARNGLAAFVKDCPDGLYRGEALQALGALSLQHDWDVRKARPYYSQVVAWCRRVRGQAQAAALLAVPDKCAEPARAPTQWQRMVPGGVIQTMAVKPGAVINRSTTTWYLVRMEEDCEFILGFLAAVEDDWELAREHFSRAASLDPLLQDAERKGYLGTMRRLRSACDKRALVGAHRESTSLTGRKRAAVMWGELAYLRRRFSQAESWNGRLYAAAEVRRDSEVMARSGLGVMLVAMQRGENDKARSVCAQIVKTCPKAAASPYAFFLYGHTFGLDADGSYSTAIRWYRQAYRRYPRSRVAEMARFYEIFKMTAHGDLGGEDELIRRFERDFPGSDYLRVLRERQDARKNLALGPLPEVR